MNLLNDKALYLLQFDHRRLQVKSLFNFEPPCEVAQVHFGFDVARAAAVAAEKTARQAQEA